MDILPKTLGWFTNAVTQNSQLVRDRSMTGSCLPKWNEWIYLTVSRLPEAILRGCYCMPCRNYSVSAALFVYI